jgi:uncharacterized protein (TIGR03086 family)
MPTDELDCAEATLAVLEGVLADLGPDDWSRQTPCREFDVASLTDHLMISITVLGGAAGAEFPPLDTDASVLGQVSGAARPALAAWHRRGLDGTASTGGGEAPAKVLVGVLSIEFLVHAWDYAAATERELDAPEELSAYVLEMSRGIITPEGRAGVGFDDPVELPGDAPALDRLLAFTGRRR